MELKLYDTLTREKRVFAPIDPQHVRMYVCGPTVYDFAHIGNARPVIVFDVLYRLLRHLYGADHVTYVRNITDVDDKINARAAERGVPIRELTEETYRNFKADVAALGCLPPTVEPRATEHIDEMKALIERLVASGNAYVAEDHVLFSVPSSTTLRACTALTRSAAFAARLFASDHAGCGRLFSDRDFWTPGQQARGRFALDQSDGTQTLRYADAREAAFQAARSEQRAHVCVRTDGL